MSVALRTVASLYTWSWCIWSLPIACEQVHRIIYKQTVKQKLFQVQHGYLVHVHSNPRTSFLNQAPSIWCFFAAFFSRHLMFFRNFPALRASSLSPLLPNNQSIWIKWMTRRQSGPANVWCIQDRYRNNSERLTAYFTTINESSLLFLISCTAGCTICYFSASAGRK